MLSNHSALFILVSCYAIVKLIYNSLILSLIRKWGINPVLTFGFWKSCICTRQSKKSIIVMVKEASPSCWLSSIGHEMHIDSTNVALWVRHLPIDLSCIAMIYLLCMQTWDACVAVWDSHTDVNWHLGDTWLLWVFWKVGKFNLLYWWNNYFAPCIILSIIYCGLVLMCSRSHVGITYIFAMDWVVLDW